MTGAAYGANSGQPRARAAVRPSPVFLAIVACFAVSGAMVWRPDTSTGRGYQLAVFAFVVSGWLISLCLHEFGHAYTAWRYGDHAVAVGHIDGHLRNGQRFASSFSTPVWVVNSTF